MQSKLKQYRAQIPGTELEFCAATGPAGYGFLDTIPPVAGEYNFFTGLVTSGAPVAAEKLHLAYPFGRRSDEILRDVFQSLFKGPLPELCQIEISLQSVVPTIKRMEQGRVDISLLLLFSAAISGQPFNVIAVSSQTWLLNAPESPWPVCIERFFIVDADGTVVVAPDSIDEYCEDVFLAKNSARKAMALSHAASLPTSGLVALVWTPVDQKEPGGELLVFKIDDSSEISIKSMIGVESYDFRKIAKLNGYEGPEQSFQAACFTDEGLAVFFGDDDGMQRLVLTIKEDDLP